MIVTSFLPESLRPNLDLVTDSWSAEKIFAKTGISCRRLASDTQTALDLGVNAALSLIAENHINRCDVGALLYCTQSPDYIIPNNVSLLHDHLGLKEDIPTIEYNQGCSGYIYGLYLAKMILMSSEVEQLLFITADTYTKYLKEDNHGCKTIFGDGAAATLIGKKDVALFGDFVFGTNGSEFSALYLKGVGAKQRHDQLDLYMNGPDVFSFTLDVVPKVVQQVLIKNKLDMQDIDYFVFHQANGFMLEALRKKIGIPTEKFCLHFSESGNTVSSTIPIVLEELDRVGKLQPGKKLLLCGFGVGLSWGATVITIKESEFE